MRTIIAGSRDIIDFKHLMNAVVDSQIKITTVVSGGARGVDKLGERYAQENELHLCIHPPDWDKHGKSAGFIRNKLMAEDAEALIAIWDGESRGTRHMIDTALRKGLKVYVLRIEEQK